MDLAFGAKATDWGNPALSACGARANGDVRPANGKVVGGGGAQAANGKPVEFDAKVDAVQGEVQVDEDKVEVSARTGDGVPGPCSTLGGARDDVGVQEYVETEVELSAVSAAATGGLSIGLPACPATPHGRAPTGARQDVAGEDAIPLPSRCIINEL